MSVLQISEVSERVSATAGQSYVPSLKDKHGAVWASAASRAEIKGPIGGYSKRAFDIAASGTALLFLAPVLLLIWVLVKIDSPGPGLFKQKRGGLYCKPFYVYKFRTMTVHSKTFKQATRNDARVTKLGATLRRLSIDELPQLINVLLGHMSIVGPRPHPTDLDLEFKGYDTRYTLRFMARPGITGLAQVNGSRGPTDTDDKLLARITYDLKYVLDWSLSKDLQIMLKTAKVLTGDAAAF